MYNPIDIIRKKRDKQALTREEIEFFINAYKQDELPDYQVSAWLMAVFLNGMNDEESAALTKAMLYSGTVLDLSDIPGVKVDKHSTGGVGDKLSLILAPIVAACGVPVPMISGRGLGHSGGTLDKLESIPGFNVNQNLQRYREILAKHNLVLIGQTEEIAPADKRMYALRDVTGTVECIPLIAGSIMSKKLAEGIDALVLDVKYGDGAFMKTQEQAAVLAQRLVSIGEDFGKQTIAYLTAMDEPLGYSIGNWLEVEESIQALKGNGPADTMEVTLLLSGTMIYLGKKAATIEEGIAMSKNVIADGSAFQKFLDIVEEQGGDVNYILHPNRYPEADICFEVKASDAGYIHELAAYELGMAAVELGAGRKKKEDRVDPVAGIRVHKKVGDKVEKDETILTCYTNKPNMEETVIERFDRAIQIDSNKPARKALISHKVDKQGISVV